MKKALLAVGTLLAGSMAFGSPLNSNARSVIPASSQQIISVDYRAMHNSPTAMELKARVLPEALKEVESSLRQMGIDPDKDVDQLTFVSFRTQKNGLRSIGIAQGQLNQKQVLAGYRKRKVNGTKYLNSILYPVSTGIQMTFLDENTILFGEPQSVKDGLSAQNGDTPGIATNADVTDQISSAESEPVWSVLDAQGTQTMLRNALGDASKLADYDTIKKRLGGSHYTLDFTRGVDFQLIVSTSDGMTSGTLSALIKAGMMYRKMGASPIEKGAIDNMTVDSDSSSLRIHYKSDDHQFQALLHSDLFASVSR
ncbi:hypothetical protein Acid345_2131 [Candidatus Koribacter versatilis Ellin345]|uniref:Uncharacterized protein n=1 Tax=Koribacter versatilis (strain Ellin345) TaxID=204669 RepID=Q1IPR8_KORVE|nr:hypothetical protein [Candidatus Koribacter versatilis]ABF41132.1 hypothetical protein Acid345_2131 [Candidatus Koribacter versatilis Ellin345]